MFESWREDAEEMRHFLILILVLGLSPASFGQDYPTIGTVYNTKEDSAVTHDCKLRGSELHCEMNQTFIRQELKESEVPKRRGQLIAQISDEEKNAAGFRQTCKELSEGYDQLEGILKKPDNQLTSKERDGIKRLSKHSLDKLRGLMSVHQAHCLNPTTKTREALASHMITTETKSCRVGSNHWQEVFVRSRGLESGNIGSSSSWVTKGEPTGACGVLLVNRFELDTSDPASKFKFWNYIARKVVTNPSGELLLGVKCSSLDESTHRHVWQSQEIGLDCRTVKLSPF